MIKYPAMFIAAPCLEADRVRRGRTVRSIAPSLLLTIFGIFLASMVSAGSTASREGLQQKVRLLERYLASPTVGRIEAGNDPEAKVELKEAKDVFDTARGALAGGDLERAAAALDEALRKITAAASGTSARPQPTGERTKAQYERIRGQIESYAAVLERDERAGKDIAGAERDRAKLEQMLETASRHANTGRYDLAGAILAEAYRLAVATVSARRKGETAFFRLTFETPADEYEYERKRNESYEILVGIMLSERDSAAGSVTALIECQVDKSRHLRDRGDAAAATGNYPAAIAAMEDATRQLIRALRAGGLPVPE